MVVERKEKRSVLSLIVEFAVIFVTAYLLASGLQNYLFGNFEILQHSMEPTLFETDRVLINRIVYYYSPPQRKDIVILIDPMGGKDDFVKRVIALPGELFEMRDGQVYINNQELDEPYLSMNRSVDNVGPYRVPGDEYFVMGDNRGVSSDSRRFGPVAKKDILGKVVVVWWPPNHTKIPKE